MFANHLPMIGVSNGNSDTTGCVRGGREEYVTVAAFRRVSFSLTQLR